MTKSVEIVEISGAERDRLLTLEESHFIDLKAVEIAPGKLSRTVSAFANASGGDVYIGLGESADFFGTRVRHWKGFKDAEAANAPPNVRPAVSIGIRLQLRVSASGRFHPGWSFTLQFRRPSQIARATDGTAYIRRGAQNLPVKGAEGLERLRLDKGVESFERHTVDADIEVVSQSDTLKRFVEHVIPTSTPGEVPKEAGPRSRRQARRRCGIAVL